MSSLLHNNLFQRVVVAVAGIPLLLWINATGGIPFLVLVLVLSLMATYEFRQLAVHRAHPPSLLLLLSMTALIQANFYFRVVDYWEALLAAIMVLYVVELWRNQGSQFLNIGSALVGLVYVNLSFGALLRLRLMGVPPGGAGTETGAALVLLMFVCVWAADIFAYFGGSRLGGRFITRKLFPRLSPKKTWEGYFSGIIGSVAVSWICSVYVAGFPDGHAPLIGLLVGVVSPAGDLMESMFKRDAGVKDSSGVIPGHGGVLDRFDTVMFIAPLIYFLTAWG
jgi:phosphatidate cytidylyltransferase